mmetsp:Transcript_83202/g.174157  ORF Transcript_83202/g.174157 Transcript_83202/m.174157 type:complete len:595 (-) Transcript_83202:183-1967(-)
MAPGRKGDKGRSRSRSTGARGSTGGPTHTVVPTVKKARKEILSKELGYNDESNPFGDRTLTDKFVWKKRNEYLQAAGLYKGSTKNQEVERIQSKVREIHQVKKRRDEREVERQLLEAQRLEQDRERHEELFDDWVATEQKFHLDNAKARSLLRIEQGRERPIDMVVKSLAIAEGQDFEDMSILDSPPYDLFKNVDINEAEEMLNDIEINLKADKNHKAFWKAMQFACNEEIESKQRAQSGGKAFGSGVADGVVSEIHDLLSAKSRDELEEMLIEIKGSLQGGGAGLDTQFFDAVAAKIPLYMARAEIADWHGKAKLLAEAAIRKQERERVGGYGSEASLSEEEEAGQEEGAAAEEEEDFSPVLEPVDDDQNFSPVLEPLSKYVGEDLLDPDDDARLMKQVRQTLLDAFGAGSSSSKGAGGDLDRSKEDEWVAKQRAAGMDSDEFAFNAAGKGAADDFHGELSLPKQSYEWEDKYKPRKPRFFNRVKTGYAWNKYNQTHFDHDNPPPKRVQGYKFNIFYPDLIDKTKAPTYYVEKDPASSETVILRFHAGPPYEDIAFKIVNCEWNLSQNFGFRVVFDRGVLQLYFNFKRHRYRR